MDIKRALILFLLFLVVLSNAFVDYIISNFNHAVTCRKPTYFGIVLQGIFLVILFSIVDYLINENIL
ncbi:B66L [African swine fever virus]|uniref:Transmembrane protein B66L n=7 Tax=African swine fever virus TaxID=10497 RepID=VFB66_ASFB7|nr:pB66L precursor [African swine fever virus]YP_009702335.1 pB66L [African swine fever virus]YP_009702493.1 pB66L [African swine fever virus]YP_009702654.1 pB66L [African swine fever virus]YP_009703144.1 B66L [African swine fever virus]YP_009703341.1 pB66L [African swine fever virus]YP_009703540.1 pB66L [African swine fever virus Benin 97/1]YP_009703695.1 pB66L [African swine fever virus OURT 88/3]YP_009927212.1 hypothetical protein IM014_gp122 [African swine fever virus]P0CAM1.1 RecName: